MSDDKTIIADPEGLTILNPPKRKRACMVQYSGAGLGRRYVIDEMEMVIGRSPTASVVINEGSVSRNHAKLHQTGEDVEIEDMGSSNGTYLNDKMVVPRAALKDGDIVRLGTVLLKFFAQDNIDNIFHDKIYRMATIDAGTQIFNKKYIQESLESEFKFSKTYNSLLSVIYYDLDFFKKVNDGYGHNAGDFVLKETAEVVKGAIRREDILGRMGGEEFCIILPNSDLATANDLAERIRKAIEQHPFQFEGTVIRQTISLGVSQLTAKMTSMKDLLEDADKKLYLAKNNGRNRVTS